MRALLLALLLLVPGPAFAREAAAESPADLRVTVEDQTGAALVTAHVTLIDPADTPHALAVDDKGIASFAALAPGAWTMRVEADAFQPYEGPLTLKKGANAVTIKLPLAVLTEQVVVTQDQSDLQGNSFTTTLSEAFVRLCAEIIADRAAVA